MRDFNMHNGGFDNLNRYPRGERWADGDETEYERPRRRKHRHHRRRYDDEDDYNDEPEDRIRMERRFHQEMD